MVLSVRLTPHRLDYYIRFLWFSYLLVISWLTYHREHFMVLLSDLPYIAGTIVNFPPPPKKKKVINFYSKQFLKTFFFLPLHHKPSFHVSYPGLHWKNIVRVRVRGLFLMLLPLGVGTQLFFGGCVPRGFKNVGSRERIFLKKWGSWERKFWKIWV